MHKDTESLEVLKDNKNLQVLKDNDNKSFQVLKDNESLQVLKDNESLPVLYCSLINQLVCTYSFHSSNSDSLIVAINKYNNNIS